MKWLKIIGLALLSIYIISPWDAHPALIDDVLMLGLMIWIGFKLRKKPAPARSRVPGKEVNIVEEAFAVLGLSPDAAGDEIRRKYEKETAQFHPDKLKQMEESKRKAAMKRQSAVIEAYNIICKAKGLVP